MMDPFSIAAGTAGLLDISWRVAGYLRDFKAAAARVEEDIVSLSHEIEALITVNRAIEGVWESERKGIPSTLSTDSDRINGLWRNVGVTLRDCQVTVEKLEILVKQIIGIEGPKVTGTLNAFKKTQRKLSRTSEFDQLRRQLTNYHSGLQVLLTALDISYTRCSQSRTDLSLGNLSGDVQLLGCQLQSEVASLRLGLGTNDGKYVCDPVGSATTLLSQNKHFYVPQTVSSIFTGREAYLEELKNDFNAASAPGKISTQKRFVIYGLGGSGKTQFCCKFAQANRENFWGVFWIDASSRESVKHSYSRIAKIGGVEPNELAAKSWLASLEQPWLLLIDNADNLDIKIDECFPEGQRGSILVTTRNYENRIHGTIGKRFYKFEKLETGEAEELILKAACEQAPWSESSRNSAAQIAKALGSLPLALVHAGKAIMNRLCTMENYLEFYNENWKRVRRTRTRAGFCEDETNLIVYSSYEIIYRGLEAAGTEAAKDAVELLKLFAFLSWENIRVDVLVKAATNPREERELADKEKGEKSATSASTTKPWKALFEKMAIGPLEWLFKDRTPSFLPSVLRDEPMAPFDELRLRNALVKLAQLSLVTLHETADSYSMHPLVHTWARERPQMSTGEQALWCEAAATMVSQCILLPPLGLTESNEYLRRDILSHVIHVRNRQEDIRARIAENLKKRRRPWPIFTPGFGPRQALQLAKFSLVYSECGLWSETEKLQVVVRDYVCGRLGPGHPKSMRIQLALAGTYWQQARTNEAAELQNQVLQACINSLGPCHHQTLKVMDTLGSSRCFQGRFKAALELHEKAIEEMAKTLGMDHEDTLIAMDNLGRVLWRYFRYDDAREYHEKAVDGLTKLLGPTHLTTLAAVASLAMTYLELGGDCLTQAHEMMVEVLEQRKMKLGKEQPYTLLAMCDLARIKSALGNTSEAESLIRTALPIAERNLGKDHFGTLAGRTHLAQVLVRQRRFTEAEEILMDVAQRQRYKSAARDDGEHPDRIIALYYLLNCYQLHGKIEKALGVWKELEEAISTIGGEKLGTKHPFAKKLAAKKAELERERV